MPNMLNGLATGIESAEGLTPEDAGRIHVLIRIYREHIAGNEEKLRYYDDMVTISDKDSKLPESIKAMNIQTGYCAKAVDYLARRSVFDGFSIEGDAVEALAEITSFNDIAAAYEEAATSELTFGHGYWCVVPRRNKKVAAITYHDPLEAAAEWDYLHKRVKYGMVITDLGRRTKTSRLEPTVVTMHTDENIVVISRNKETWDKWTAEYIPNNMGEPMMVAMRFKPSRRQPFGKSRISRASRSLVDQAIVATQNLVAHDKYFAIPQKYLLNLSEEQYDALAGKEQKVYANDVLLGVAGEDGQRIDFGALQIGGVSEHISIIANIVQRFAAENDMPMAAFGELGNFTSSDALNATSHDIVVLATNMNRNNRKALIRVAQMALCVYQNKTMAELTEEERGMTAHFADPSMLTISQAADASLKVTSIVPGYAETDVFWERMGFDEDERHRIATQMTDAERRTIAANVLGQIGISSGSGQ